MRVHPPALIHQVYYYPVKQKPARRASSAAIFIAFTAALAVPAGLPAEAEARITAPQPGPAPARELRPGIRQEQELKGGETLAYGVELSAGQYLEVSVRQKGIDAVVKAFSPDGAKITEVDNDPADGTEYVLLSADATGRYRLEVLSPDKEAAAGTVEIKVEQLREATGRDLLRVTAARAFESAEELRAQQTTESLRKAIDKYNEALPLWREAGDKRGEAYTLNQIGLTCSRTGEAKEAVEFYEQSLPLWREVGDRLNESIGLSNIGVAYWRLGDSQKALEYNKRSLALAEAGEYREVEALTINNIGTDYWALGQPEEAFKYYERSLALTRDRRKQALTLNNMATDCEQLGDVQRAMDYLNRALPLRRAVGDRRGESNTLHNLGRVYAELGEHEQALQYFDQALQLSRALGDRQGEAVTLQVMGVSCLKLGELDRAQGYSASALELSRVVGDRRTQAYELNDLGVINQSIGETQKALDYLNQALSVAREVGDKREELYVLNNLGSVYAKSGEAARAAEFHGKALELSRETNIRLGEASALYGLARADSETGDTAKARAQIEEALQIVESTRTKVADQQLRTSYLASNQELYQFYVDLLMRMHRGNPAGGFDAAALQASERARARGLLDMLTESRADIRQGVDPELLARERLLQQQLNVRAERLTRLLGAKHTEEQSEAARKEIESLLADYREAEAQIRARSPRYAALTQPRPLSAAEIQKELDPDTALLEYSLGEERSFLWVVTSSSLQSFVLPGRAVIEAQARRVYDLLTARNRVVRFEEEDERAGRLAKADAEYAVAAGDLSRTILGPVAGRLRGKRLVVVADGTLQYVPFAALPMLDGSSARGRRVSEYVPLIVGHEVVSLPSASVLGVLRKESAGRSPAPKAVAVIADPVFDSHDERVKISKANAASAQRAEGSAIQIGGSSDGSLTRSFRDLASDGEGVSFPLPRLRFTRLEAEEIVASAPAGQYENDLDFAAGRAAATSPRLAQYRYVHFATHVIINTRHPELSGIVLSLAGPDGSPRDGFLLAQEVYNLRLPAELVVLSGCRTGLGKEVKGEGLMSLTRGFMYAGSPRVIVSLWDVNDRSTAELMGRLYRGLLGSGHLRPAEALRRAQLAMWGSRQWKSPYYWAAFVLSGEYR